MKTVVVILLIVIVVSIVLARKKSDVSCNDFWKKRADGAFVIDVRSAQEYASGHVDDARNIPHDIIGAKIDSLTSNKTAQILLYCRSGNRSGAAKQTLVGLGYSNVVNAGGYDALVACKPAK